MKSGIRSCPTNEVQHGLVTHQRFPCPVFANVTEHVMFNPIPFRRPWRIVRYTDYDPKLVRQSLQFHLPRPVPRPIAAPAIGFDQPPLGVRVAIATLLEPPPPDRGNCKGCRLMGCPDPDIASVPALIVNTIRDTDANRIPAKVMIQHLATLATVAAAPDS